MSHKVTIFDTHEQVKNFQKAGFKDEQAEAIVKAISTSREFDLSRLATKEQIIALEKEIGNVEEKLTAKIEAVEEKLTAKIEAIEEKLTAKIDNGLAKLETNMLKWFIATAIAMTGIIIAAIKFIH